MTAPVALDVGVSEHKRCKPVRLMTACRYIDASPTVNTPRCKPSRADDGPRYLNAP
jgi:hypothetical protein